MKDDRKKSPDPTPLGDLAQKAARAAQDQAAAFEAERLAEVKLLEEAIRLALPGLPAICSKVQGWPMECVQVAPGLMLATDGSFGAWSTYPPILQLLTIGQVIEEHDPAEIVEALSKLFMKQIMGRGTSAAGSQERTAKLLALAALIGDI